MIFSKRSLMMFLSILCMPATGSAMEMPNQQDAYIDAQSNRAMVPLRWVSEKLGATVEWKQTLQEVLIRQNGKEVSLKIGAKQASVDGNRVLLDQPAVVKNNMTFVPVRFVSEALGTNVRWVESSGIIELWTNDKKLQLQVNHSVDSSEEGYSNDRFSNVIVTKVGENKYQISGKAKVSEGRFQYVVEDGHNELIKGSGTASIPAPDWGAFQLEITVKKVQENSTLTFILFEQGIKDNRRKSELAVPLP
jgi:hypothetical protein